MSQKELIDAICEQANIQTKKVLEEAEEAAGNIVRKAESELGKINEAAVERARSSVRNEESKIRNDASLAAKKEILKAKHDLVEKAMVGLQSRLEELPAGKGYPRVFEMLMREAVEGAEGKVTIRCRPQDVKLAKETASRLGLDIAVEEAGFKGGLEARWGDGRFIRRNTFESRLEKIYPDLLREANHLIFDRQGA